MNDKYYKIRQVREQTGYPYVDCFQALEATGGDIDRAVVLLTEMTAKITRWYTAEDSKLLKRISERKREREAAEGE